ncbi:MAG TPA: hypothetical protein VMJ10_15830 [Kofleriaceae bacterium]|nr:hypothetical protein [Kofleriaceae bacterium]
MQLTRIALAIVPSNRDGIHGATERRRVEPSCICYDVAMCWRSVVVAAGVAAAGCVRGNPAGIGPDASPPPVLHTISITLAGDGYGVVEIGEVGDLGVDVSTTCSSSCSVEVEDGSSMALVYHTPDEFTGWSVACVPITNELAPAVTADVCGLGAVGADVSVTATFAKDEQEVTAVLPSVPSDVGTFLADGDLVVAGEAEANGSGGGVVSRISAQGATVWTLPLNVGTIVSVRAADSIYVLGASAVEQISLAGDPIWTVPLSVGQLDVNTPSALAITPAGDAVIGTNPGPEVLSQVDGSVVWSRTVGSWGELAVDSAGHVAMLGSNGVSRFDASGNALASWPAPVDPCGYVASIAFDSQDGLYLYCDGNVTHYDATGSPATFSAPHQQAEGYPTVAVLAAVGLDDHVLAITDDFSALVIMGDSAWGAQVESLSPAGASDWTVNKPGVTSRDLRFGGVSPFDAVHPTDVACTASGLCAVFGRWLGGPTPYWIELFQQ